MTRTFKRGKSSVRKLNAGPGHAVLLIHSLEVGGAQRSIITTAASWPPSSTCEIISARGGTFLPKAEKAAATRIIAERWPSLSGIVRYMFTLRKIVRSEQPAVLLTNSYGITRITLLLKKLGGLGRIPLIVVEQSTFQAKVAGLYRGRVLHMVMILLTRWLYRSADAIVGVSEGVSRDVEEALNLSPGAVTTIFNPIDTKLVRIAAKAAVLPSHEKDFNSLPRPIILSAGRLVAAKAQADLLKAFAALPTRARGSLVILGDGPLRVDLVRQAQSLGIVNRLWLPGFVDNPWWFMARADVFVLTSRWEGLPLILLEAVACGVPVVSTDCPSGPSEILQGIRRSRLTPVGNPAAVADAIAELIAENRCVTDDADPLAKFEADFIAQQYETLIRSVSEEPSLPRMHVRSFSRTVLNRRHPA